MNFLTHLAHGAEQHTAETSTAEHVLTQWFVALPLFVVVFVLLLALLKEYGKLTPPQLMLVAMALLFFVGVGTYSLVPVVSIVGLTLGIALALFFTLVSIAK